MGSEHFPPSSRSSPELKGYTLRLIRVMPERHAPPSVPSDGFLNNYPDQGNIDPEQRYLQAVLVLEQM